MLCVITNRIAPAGNDVPPETADPSHPACSSNPRFAVGSSAKNHHGPHDQRPPDCHSLHLPCEVLPPISWPRQTLCHCSRNPNTMHYISALPAFSLSLSFWRSRRSGKMIILAPRKAPRSDERPGNKSDVPAPEIVRFFTRQGIQILSRPEKPSRSGQATSPLLYRLQQSCSFRIRTPRLLPASTLPFPW